MGVEYKNKGSSIMSGSVNFKTLYNIVVSLGRDLVVVKSQFRLAIFVCLIASHAIGDERLSSFNGTWSSPSTSVELEAWRFEDFKCTIGCDANAYKYLRNMVNQPENKDRPYSELFGEIDEYVSKRLPTLLTEKGLELRLTLDPQKDASLDCEPFGLVRQVLTPYPLIIYSAGGNIIIKYEEWSVSRTIYMDGRPSQENAPLTLLGHSVGLYEGDSLVVTTTGIRDNIFWPAWGLAHSDQLRTVERYTRVDGGSRLELELTIEDPKIFKKPWIIYKPRLSTPKLNLLDYDCEKGLGIGD